MTPKIERESPLADDLELLFARHTADMHADTPPESIHMLPREDLVSPDIAFFVLRVAGKALAMGAIKHLPVGPDGLPEAEIKSMHVLSEARGKGFSRLMLQALVDHARTSKVHRLNLETGIQPTFIAARGLYERAGFVECPPFQGYQPDPNSVFMTLDLANMAPT